MSEPPKKAAPYNPLERASAVSRVLNDAARRARFSTRSRGAYQNFNPEARRAEKFMKIARLVLAIAVILIPNAASIAYFGAIASSQYESEAKFTVSSGAIPKLDGLGVVTGLPQALIFQDMQIIVNFIESRDLVERLEKAIRLRSLYSLDTADFYARFDADKPIEKFVKYWLKMTKTSISPVDGIITFKARAFSPEDSKRIVEATISACEDLVNSLNAHMYQETIAAAQRSLNEATANLKVARVAFETARNAEGLLDANQASTGLNAMLTALTTQLLKAQAELQTRGAYLNEGSPQLRQIRTQVQSLQAQIADVRARMTSVSGPEKTKPLSGSLARFSTLELDQRIAEGRYAVASAALSGARQLSEVKAIFLHRVVAPAIPEESTYPKRKLYIGGVFVASLLLWAILVGLVGFIRNNMA